MIYRNSQIIYCTRNEKSLIHIYRYYFKCLWNSAHYFYTIHNTSNGLKHTSYSVKAVLTPALTPDLTAPRTYWFLAAPLTPSSIALLRLPPDLR